MIIKFTNVKSLKANLKMWLKPMVKYISACKYMEIYKSSWKEKV
jgi:hypothetical protein